MRRKYSKNKLQALEKEMRDPAKWEAADHTVSYRGPTSVRFPLDTLKKLAKALDISVDDLIS